MKTIAIIGLGLMGGSLAARVRKRFPKVRIIGISRNRAALHLALKRKWVHEISDRLESARHADFVVLCTPIDTFAKLLLALERICSPRTLVTDVGSVKGEIAQWTSRKKFRNIQFVGAHPMAGSHARGIQVARENLYDHSLTFVVHSSSASRASFKIVKNFWSKISSRVVEISAKDHDRVTAEISHLPHALASCLALTPVGKNLKFAASGFADTTRIAASDPSIWLPIFFANRKEVSRAIKLLETKLAGFRATILKQDTRALLKSLKQAKDRRDSLQN